MSIEACIVMGLLSFAGMLVSYKLGYLDGASAQRLEDYRRWVERKTRWREFEDD